MDSTEALAITIEQYVAAAEDFIIKSNNLNDGWKLIHNQDLHKSYLKKETFISKENLLLKAEYIIFYNLSYGVPSFSFNMWNSSGVLLKLEEIRKMSCVQINQKDFYSVITQQEHPVISRPYFILHPCHTEELLATFKNNSINIIVTFLGLVTPLIKINLKMEYGV